MEKKCNKKKTREKKSGGQPMNKSRDITLSAFLKVDPSTNKMNSSKNLTEPTNSNEIVSIFDTTNVRVKKAANAAAAAAAGKFKTKSNRELGKYSPTVSDEKHAKMIKELINEMEHEDSKERLKRLEAESCDSAHFGKMMDRIDKDKEHESP